MSLILSLTAAAGAQTARATQQASNIAGAQGEVMTERAGHAVASGVLPLSVALAVLGCLVVSAFILLIRESRIERRYR